MLLYKFAKKKKVLQHQLNMEEIRKKNILNLNKLKKMSRQKPRFRPRGNNNENDDKQNDDIDDDDAKLDIVEQKDENQVMNVDDRSEFVQWINKKKVIALCNVPRDIRNCIDKSNWLTEYKEKINPKRHLIIFDERISLYKIIWFSGDYISTLCQYHDPGISNAKKYVRCAIFHGKIVEAFRMDKKIRCNQSICWIFDRYIKSADLQIVVHNDLLVVGKSVHDVWKVLTIHGIVDKSNISKELEASWKEWGQRYSKQFEQNVAKGIICTNKTGLRCNTCQVISFCHATECAFCLQPISNLQCDVVEEKKKKKKKKKRRNDTDSSSAEESGSSSEENDSVSERESGSSDETMAECSSESGSINDENDHRNKNKKKRYKRNRNKNKNNNNNRNKNK